MSLRLRTPLSFVMGSLGLLPLAACGPQVLDGTSVTTERTGEGVTGCHGKASSMIPASGDYFLTSFGAGSDNQPLSCGGSTQNGNWFFAASRQRYGCGARIRIEANGKCVVAETDDYGPDVCVENAAGGPIIDASPLVSEALFGTSSAGWSDHYRIHVTQVDATTPLGDCQATTQPMPPPQDPPPQTAASCHSSTLDADVPSGTCVQSSSDGNWYHCDNGGWASGQTNCTTSYAWCHSSTLDKDVPPRTCVQSVHDSQWYQCGADGWDSPVANGAGPVGTCSAEYPLN